MNAFPAGDGPLSSSNKPAGGAFVATHWSMVLAAGQQGTPQAHAALESLCQTYWYPLYVYIRRRGYRPEDAEDLTQGFFSQLLRSDFLASANRERGRFRSFLLTALNHFLADERDRARACKRGGKRKILSWDGETAETRYQLEPVNDLTPEKVYEQRWARTLLAKVIHRLRQEYEISQRGALFTRLKPCLTQARAAVPYAELANQLGITEGALRVSVHRLRQRYRELLQLEIASTVAAPAEIEEELRHLLRVLAE